MHQHVQFASEGKTLVNRHIFGVSGGPPPEIFENLPFKCYTLGHFRAKLGHFGHKRRAFCPDSGGILSQIGGTLPELGGGDGSSGPPLDQPLRSIHKFICAMNIVKSENSFCSSDMTSSNNERTAVSGKELTL